jgi:hypothetical protein
MEPSSRWGTRETLLVFAIVLVFVAGMMPSVLGFFARASAIATTQGDAARHP